MKSHFANCNIFFPFFHPAAIALVSLMSLSVPSSVNADEVSFAIDPASLPDTNMDGFVNDSDFVVTGSGPGMTVFTLTPTDNLTGPDRFLISEDNGLQYGGGGGSTLSFDFTVSNDVSLESYTLGNGFFLSNPSFNITEGSTILSSSNTSNAAGETHAFNGGPIELTAGTTYSFEAQVTGAAVQAFVESWTFSTTAVPEPSSSLAIVFGCVGLTVLRRRERT